MAQKLTDKEKKDIQRMLVSYAEGYDSQSKAANSLQGITSPGTFNAIVNGKFENVSDNMFLKIRAAIAAGQTDGWRLCETAAFKDVETFLDDAQRYHNVSWVVGPAGIGKTTAAYQYARGHRNVFVLPCSEDMHKAEFVEDLAKKIGIRNDGLTVRATLNRIECVTMEAVKKTAETLFSPEAAAFCAAGRLSGVGDALKTATEDWWKQHGRQA